MAHKRQPSIEKLNKQVFNYRVNVHKPFMLTVHCKQNLIFHALDDH